MDTPSSTSVLMINGGGAGKFQFRSRSGRTPVIPIASMAFPLCASDILRSGRLSAVSMAVHDDVDGTRFENRPTCARNAAAMLDEPPVIELIEAFRLDGFERSKKPTGNGKMTRETLELKSTQFYMSQSFVNCHWVVLNFEIPCDVRSM